MMWKIVPMLFVVVLAATNQADAVPSCERGQVSSRTGAGAQQQRSSQVPPAAATLMGLALLATGAITRRSTIERA